MTYGQLQSVYEESRKEIESLRQELQYANSQIKALKEKLFGAKSERFDPNQTQLSLQGLQEIELKVKEALAAQESPKPAPAKRRPAGSPRRVIPDHLRVEEIVLEPSPEDLVCDEHGAKVKIGEERTEEVDIIPPEFIKRVYIRPVYACKPCAGGVVSAPAPERPAGKGWAGPGLLAWIVLSKYVDHLPLFRQERIFRDRYGVTISRKTMCDWVQQVAFWLKPIYNHIHNNLLRRSHLHCDETPVKLKDPDRKGKTRHGYLWVLTAPGEDVVFQFETGRSGKALDTLLENWQGTLHCDDYAAYDAFARTHTEVILARCWAHVRRKFWEAREEAPWLADLVLRLIGHLYAVDRRCRDRADGPKLRLVQRQADSKASLMRLKRVLIWMGQKRLPASGLGKAVSYALSNWEDLTRFMEDGRVALDNNLVENAIRPTAIGKKNWLFIGHPAAGPAGAIIYSLVESCKRHGVEPFEYLRDVLDRLPRQTNQQIAAFTPRVWAAARKAAPASPEPAQPPDAPAQTKAPIVKEPS